MPATSSLAAVGSSAPESRGTLPELLSPYFLLFRGQLGIDIEPVSDPGKFDLSLEIRDVRDGFLYGSPVGLLCCHQSVEVDPGFLDSGPELDHFLLVRHAEFADLLLLSIRQLEAVEGRHSGTHPSAGAQTRLSRKHLNRKKEGNKGKKQLFHG